MEFIVFCNQGRWLDLMLILVDVSVFGAINQGGWSNFQGKKSQNQTTLYFRVVEWFLQSGQVSSKLERWYASPPPGPVVDSVLREKYAKNTPNSNIADHSDHRSD